MNDFWLKHQDNPSFATMTVLAEVEQTEDLDDWADLGASYTVLWDVDDLTTQAYDVTDRPMFVVVDTDMTILLRASNSSGLRQAEELVESLL